MEIPVKIHYPHFLDDQAVYHSLEQFWEKELDASLRSSNVDWQPFYQNEEEDGNPIFSAWFPQKGKLLRIIQFVPEEGDKLFAAWMDHWQGDFPKSLERPADFSDAPIQELVLDLAMTNETILLAKYLIHFWIEKDYSTQQMEAMLAPFKEIANS